MADAVGSFEMLADVAPDAAQPVLNSLKDTFIVNFERCGWRVTLLCHKMWVSKEGVDSGSPHIHKHTGYWH